MKERFLKIYLLLILAFEVLFANAQNNDYPYNIPNYSFINYENNKLIFGSKSDNFKDLFSRLDTLIFSGKGKINIVHIGASHVQADQYSGRIRERFFNFMPGLISNRGVLFPYSMAKTNHPFNYYSTYSGKWTSCRNVEINKNCNMGVMGISAFTTDSIAGFNIFLKHAQYPEFHFSNIKVLHATGDSIYDIDLLVDSTIACFKTVCNGYTLFETDHPIDTLSFRILKTDSSQHSFELYGVIAGINNADGITYNAIGINGASIASYQRCNLFKEHLALLNPDLVILSLGINDVQSKDFSADNFERNYDLLVKQIRAVNPDVSIIFTTNSDSYFKRKRPNKNSELAREVSFRLIEKYENTALWDWLYVMGGLGKIKQWEIQNLAKKDLVHFTKEGYFLLGDLFFAAFIKSFEDYLKKNEY